MDNKQPTNVYVTENRDGFIGIPECLVMFAGAIIFVYYLLYKAITWALAVAADPLSRPYEAILVAFLACIAGYLIWRCVRRTYLIIRALWFLIYDCGQSILFFFKRKFR